jgi:hypothetical protein
VHRLDRLVGLAVGEDPRALRVADFAVDAAVAVTTLVIAVG